MTSRIKRIIDHFLKLILIPVFVSVISPVIAQIDLSIISNHILPAVIKAAAAVPGFVSVPLFIGISSFFLIRHFKQKFGTYLSGKRKKLLITNLSATELIREQRIPESLRLHLLGFQNSGGLIAYQKNICGPAYEPGTFRLSEIESSPPLLKDSPTYDQWLGAAVTAEIQTLRRYKKSLLKNYTDSALVDMVKEILECRTETGEPLKHHIWYQEYSDILRRILLHCTGNDPDMEMELFPKLTVKCYPVILDIIRRIERTRNPSLEEWLSISIAAGLLGVNEKSPHTAASAINSNQAIPLSLSGESQKESVARIAEALYQLAKTPTRIDASHWFCRYLKISKDIKTSIVVFPDDFIETIFLLRYYQKLIMTFPNIRVYCIPRMIRCGNDARYRDFKRFFKFFKELRDSSRFKVCPVGPKLGTVNITKLNRTVLTLIEESDFVEARGARNYEMMQGIRKDALFGFMVCREFSEATTGLHAEDQPLIYLKQPEGERSFDGFRQRSQRLVNNKWFCTCTAADHPEKWNGGHLASYQKWSPIRQNRYETTQQFYSRTAVDFDQKFGDLLEMEIVELFNQFKGRLLVLGCGSGKEVNYLTQMGNDTFGIDFSVEAIRLAKKRYPQLWNKFFVEDLYNLEEFSHDYFDGIVANASLVHLLKNEDLDLILQKCHNRLRPSGQLFIRLLNKGDLKNEFDTHLFNNRRWFVYYNDAEVKDAASKAGFTVLTARQEHHRQHNSVTWLTYLLQKKE